MFLILLLIFPILSTYVFGLFKVNIKEINWIVKLIWIVWLFIIVYIIEKNIFQGHELYLAILIIWYFLVFNYFYICSIRLQIKNIDKFKYSKVIYSDLIIKLYFFIIIFILTINIFDNNRNINNIIYLVNDFFYYFLFSLIFYWLIYEILDMVKNFFFRRILSKKIYREKLKEELKQEILYELTK